MPQIIDALYRSEKIVKSIGSSVLANGKTTTQFLTIDNVPYWDVFASELASRYIPSALHEPTDRELVTQFIKPIVVKTKNFIQDIKQIHKNRTKNKEKINLNNILCLEFMPAQSRDVMKPVKRYLADQKDINILSLGDREWPSNREELNSNEHRRIIWEFWSNELSSKAKNLSAKLNSVKKFILKSKHLEQVIDKCEPGSIKKIKYALNRLFIEFPSLIRQGVISTFILEKYKPSLLIVTDVHDPRTRMYILQCKHLNIPCLALQHGLTNAFATEWRFCTADRVAVWGNHFKEILGAHGIASNKIKITGAPRSDSLIKTDDLEGKLLKKKLGIPESARIILLASTFTLPSYEGLHNDSEILEKMKREIFDSIGNFKNIYLIGFSFGAHPLIHEASINNKIKAAVLFNPATNMIQLGFRNKTSSDLDKYTKKHRNVNLITKFKFLLDAIKYNMYKEAKKIRCPLYVYHIKNDNSVPVEQSFKLKKHIISKNKFVHKLGSNHGLRKEIIDGTFKSKLLHDAFVWIEKNS